ncbi:L-histidine N(alpha)-methyltransferase [Chryseolinea sp. H1M3-3]|uniref:L-histidine N(alpha)-methyltransferase n=1 Tax=Chryseolinea sp. H1M3-3 TaxID=3034144 RepID=UPI0023ECA7AF|nr:L-histidine N(alpha)-methyltransferase [Chryseolinea sp. H1M3-3]
MNIEVTSDIIHVVEKGLLRERKSLPSWLFYDENGDRIFQEIMRMPEYYLTACEYEILQMNKGDILKRFHRYGPFQLVELGAGDGMKTEILLKHFVAEKTDFSYHPIDISSSVLEQLQRRLQKSLPALRYYPQQGEYIDALSKLNLSSEQRKVILFLGSNIGNFTLKRAKEFLKHVSASMHVDDLFFLGVDLKKDPRVIRRAYDDATGITKRFNMNLLSRLNRELGANFMLDQFDHYATYDPETGEAKSYLVSLREQDVYVDALNRNIHFARWEYIHTEVSLKYDQPMLEELAEISGLQIIKQYWDGKHNFTNVIFVKPR